MTLTSGYADPEYGVESYGSGNPFFGAHSMPRCQCFISFTSDPGDPPVWEDVSTYLRAFGPKRGRTYELDQFSPGTLSVTLDNRDRRFDPDYTGSPYYPNVLPMRRIKIVATWGVDYTQFDGYIDGWPQNYLIPHESNVTLTATDAFKSLSLTKLPQSVYEYEVRQDSPLHWWRMGEKQGAVAADSGSNPVTGSLNGLLNYSVTGSSPFDGDTAMEFVDPAANGGGYFQADGPLPNGDWTIEFWTRDVVTATYLNQGPSSRIGSNFWYFNATVNEVTDGSFNYLYTDVRWAFTMYDTALSSQLYLPSPGFRSADAAAGWHHIAATRSSGIVSLYTDGVLRNSHAFAFDTLSGPIFFPSLGSPPGATLPADEIAIYNTGLSAGRILAHYNAATQAWAGETADIRINRVLDGAGFSASDRSVETGISTLGSAVLSAQDGKSHINDVELAEGGRFFISRDGTATFYNRHHFATAPNNDPVATFGDFKN